MKSTSHIREALRAYQGSALVHYESTQRKADAAWRVLSPHLTDDERTAIALAAGCFHDDPQGHPARDFNDACEVVWHRLDMMDGIDLTSG